MSSSSKPPSHLSHEIALFLLSNEACDESYRTVENLKNFLSSREMSTSLNLNTLKSKLNLVLRLSKRLSAINTSNNPNFRQEQRSLLEGHSKDFPKDLTDGQVDDFVRLGGLKYKFLPSTAVSSTSRKRFQSDESGGDDEEESTSTGTAAKHKLLAVEETDPMGAEEDFFLTMGAEHLTDHVLKVIRKEIKSSLRAELNKTGGITTMIRKMVREEVEEEVRQWKSKNNIS